MTIRTHTYAAHTADTCTVTGTGHIHRSGYVRASGADRYVSTHTAPAGRTYVVRDNTTDPDTATALDVWCVPTYTDAHGNALADRYGMPVVDMDGTTAYVATADGMGYASTGTGTYGAPTVPATDATPVFDADMTETFAGTYAATHMHAMGARTADDATGNDGVPSTDDTCRACGLLGVRLDTVAPGTYVTIHMHRGDGTGATVTRTVAGTVEHDTIDADTEHDGWTIVRVVYPGGAWTSPSAGDYVAHVDDAGDYTPDTYTATVAATDTTDDDTYVTVFGRPVRAHVARSMGVVDPAPWSGPIPGRTYTGTSRGGTDYTMTTDGAVTTRTYADGTVTRADINHMWTTRSGRTVTYVVAEGTYWQSDAEGNYDRVSSASWPMVATCGHSFGGYGACIAPTGHPHTDHRDANGHTFNGPAMARYGAPIGPVVPDTYAPVDIVRGAYMARTDDGVSRLHDDTYRVSAMVAAIVAGADADMYDAATHTETMHAYVSVVRVMAGDPYGTPTALDGPTYAAMADVSAIAPVHMANMWTDVHGTTPTPRPSTGTDTY